MPGCIGCALAWGNATDNRAARTPRHRSLTARAGARLSHDSLTARAGAHGGRTAGARLARCSGPTH
jgi:hypothetical protein